MEGGILGRTSWEGAKDQFDFGVQCALEPHDPTPGLEPGSYSLRAYRRQPGAGKVFMALILLHSLEGGLPSSLLG